MGPGAAFATASAALAKPHSAHAPRHAAQRRPFGDKHHPDGARSTSTNRT
jgi:hypothetical protein